MLPGEKVESKKVLTTLRSRRQKWNTLTFSSSDFRHVTVNVAALKRREKARILTLFPRRCMGFSRFNILCRHWRQESPLFRWRYPPRKQQNMILQDV